MSSAPTLEHSTAGARRRNPMPRMWDLRVASGAGAAWAFAALLMNEASAGFLWGSVAASFVAALGFLLWFCWKPGIRGRRHSLPGESIRLSVMLILIACGCVGLRCCVERASYENNPIHQMVMSHEQVRCSIQVNGRPIAMKSGSKLVTVRANKCENLRGLQAGDILLEASIGAAQHVVQGQNLLVLGRLQATAYRGAPIAGQIMVDQILHRGTTDVFASWAQGTRMAMRSALSQASHAAHVLFPGVSLGDKSAMTRSDAQAFRAASLSHILVISGFHTGLVTAMVSSILPGRGLLRAGVSVLILVLICAITGANPSVIRASLMTASCLLARLVGWGNNGGVGLSFAVFVMLVHNPWNASDVGFCLSVAATAGLLWPTQKTRRTIRSIFGKKKGVGRWMRKLLEVTAVAFWAQMSIIPIAVLAGIPVAPWGIVANVAVAPVVGIVCMGGMILAILSPVSPFLAQIVVRIIDPLAQWVFCIAYWCVELPYSTVRLTAADLLMCVGVIALFLMWRHWKTEEKTRQRRYDTHGHMTGASAHVRLLVNEKFSSDE